MSQETLPTPTPALAAPPIDNARKWIVLLVAFLGYMFDGMEMAMVPQIAKPAIRQMVGAATSDANLVRWHQIIESMFLFGAAFGGLAFGWLGDKVGRVRAMSVSILVYSLLTACLYFVQTPLQFCVLRFVAAVGMGGEWALGLALVMEVWDGKKRPLLAGLIAAASNAGFVLIGLVTMIWPINMGNWRNLVLVGAIPAFLTVFIRLYIPESPKWKHANAVRRTRPLKELVTGSYLGITGLCIVFTTVVLMGTWGAVQKIPAWVSGMPNVPKSAAGLVQFLSGIGGVIGCMLAPLLANFLNRRLAYLLLCVGSFIGCWHLFAHFHLYSTQLLVMIFLVGGITPAFYGWIALYLPELFPTRIRATAQGISYNFGRIMAGVGAVIGGLSSGNYAENGLFIMWIYVLGMVTIWFAPETKGKGLPE